MCHSHLLLRQYDLALSRLYRAVERAPKFTPAYLLLACAYVELGRLDDARGAIKSAMEITPQYTVREIAKLWPYAIDELHNRVVGALRKAGLPEG